MGQEKKERKKYIYIYIYIYIEEVFVIYFGCWYLNVSCLIKMAPLYIYMFSLDSEKVLSGIDIGIVPQIPSSHDF